MLISARARGYLCNLIHVSLFRIPIHEKQEKGKGGNGDLNYIWSKDSFVNILNVLKEKDFFATKKSLQFLHNKMKRKWFIQSLWTPFSLWNYFISDQSDLVLIYYYPIIFPLALCLSEASFERSYQPFWWQLFRYSNIQLLEFSRVMFKLSW